MIRKLFITYITVVVLALAACAVLLIRLARNRSEAGSIYLIVFAILTLVLLVTAIAGYFLSRHFQRAIGEIEQTINSISRADFEPMAPINATGYMGELAAAVNRMREELSKKLEDLTSEKERLESMIRSMREGVVSVDSNGRIVHVNESAQLLLNIPLDSRTKPLWDVIRHDDVISVVRDVLSMQQERHIEAIAGARSLVVFVTPIRTGGAVLVAHDVTDAKKYEGLRKEFVANVSHELRTPLTFIKGYVETLKDGNVRDEAKTREFLETIDKNVQQLSNLVEDLLELSRLESGSEMAKVRPVGLKDLLQRVTDRYTVAINKKRQELHLESSPDLSQINADPDLLERAIGNLLDNAIKYTPENGGIWIRTNSLDDAVEISVSDTGIGIPNEDLPRIFERFYRVDKSRSREMGGTGLGLAIVKHIAQLHNGSVAVQSTQGKGSTFVLKLPGG